VASIRFLGAAGTVTGSRYLVRTEGAEVLVDAGLFQGAKDLRLRNWSPFPVPASSLDAVVLTHAHIDHTGALPLLVRQGLQARVWCTPATRDLCGLLLPDSARLQEEEARYANQRGYSRHAPQALPLYGEGDALSALKLLHPLPYLSRREIAPGLAITFRRAGHILGSATVELEIAEPGQAPVRLLFSGDLGRYGVPILADPDPAPGADEILVESTYGDRLHAESARDALRDEIRAAVARDGAVVIPAFAVGRTQEVLFDLRALEQAGEIPELPVFVDSPMAVDATPIYLAHREDQDEEMTRLISEGVEPLRPARLRFARSPEQSKAINRETGPCVILSASGMATGGRVLHHLARRLPDPRCTVLLVGFQAGGTRGARLQAGEKEIRIHGEMVPVRARVASISGFSAHADHAGMTRWLATLPRAPRRAFCVHGEPAALEAEAGRLRAMGWNAVIPRYLEEFRIGG
jgi:metallo-beta-lactamase family protein